MVPVVDFPVLCWACHRRIPPGAPVAREVVVVAEAGGASVEAVRIFHAACAPAV